MAIKINGWRASIFLQEREIFFTPPLDNNYYHLKLNIS